MPHAKLLVNHITNFFSVESHSIFSKLMALMGLTVVKLSLQFIQIQFSLSTSCHSLFLTAVHFGTLPNASHLTTYNLSHNSFLQTPYAFNVQPLTFLYLNQLTKWGSSKARTQFDGNGLFTTPYPSRNKSHIHSPYSFIKILLLLWNTIFVD